MNRYPTRALFEAASCALSAEAEAPLFDEGSAAEPPADPLHRQIWDRLNEKYRSC